MKLSSLAALLAGNLSATDFAAEIASEMAVLTRGIEEAGGVAPVLLTEDTDLVLDSAALSALRRLFADGRFTMCEVAYIADALQLSERVEFSGPEIAKNLAEFSAPEITGPLVVARALDIAGGGNRSRPELGVVA